MQCTSGSLLSRNTWCLLRHSCRDEIATTGSSKRSQLCECNYQDQEQWYEDDHAAADEQYLSKQARFRNIAMQHKITSCLLGTVTRCHCQREGWPGVLTSSKRDRRVARSGFIPCHTAFAVVRIFPIRSRVASAHAFKPLV